MHKRDPKHWQHEHRYTSAAPERGERNTHRVIALTAAMMVIEIVAGTAFGSMALLADGWHMASHASALGITAFAYWYGRRRASDARYSFGTGKVGVLGGYSSAVVLGLIACLIAWESTGRLWEPVPIRFDEAILVASVGLAVNLFCAYLLREHTDAAGHHVHHHDHNLRGAYLHALADALTSLLAIGALLSGRFFGWQWMDPAMGLVGAAVIARWSYGLLRDSSRVLLDGAVPLETFRSIAAAIEDTSDDLVADLHVWRIGPKDLAAIVSVATHEPRTPDEYKKRVSAAADLSHVTVEVNRCAPLDDDHV